MKATKPLGAKAYGSIGHLPSSRLGPGDYHVHEGQARICTEKARDKYDTVIVQEKIDGSCCAVAIIDGSAVPLTRKGYEARTSPFEQHHIFADWVAQNEQLFHKVLRDGERLVGEWIAQAHGTIYPRVYDPFVAFDIMRGAERFNYQTFTSRIDKRFRTPECLSYGITVRPEEAFDWMSRKQYVPEGIVYRVERYGVVDFLAKWVRPDYVPGKYLPEISGCDPVWNWRPK